MKRNMKIFGIGLIISFSLLGCKQIQHAADSILKPSAREIYARDFKTNPKFDVWENVFKQAQEDSLSIPHPFVLEGRFHPENLFAYSYDLELEKGDRLHVDLVLPADSSKVFVDIFQKSNGGSLKHLKSGDIEPGLSLGIEETGAYKIIVQPELFADFPFTILIYTQPVYGFPVAGAGNGNIQSFWGAHRDGGNRSHEGVDVFAARGTPVIASAEGRIGFTGERGLGGKQVWLRDGLFGNSLYYAHLDSVAVSSGQKVQPGDTLGFVGNTGNAKNTPPHLHFGIYQGYGGAVDPLPFIRERQVPEADSGFDKQIAIILRNGSELRLGPSTKNRQIASLSKNDSVFVLGKADKWYHVAVSDSLKGFMHGSLLGF